MKKILFIGLFALLSVLSARAYDFVVDDIAYNVISDTEVEVTYKGKGFAGMNYGYSGSVVIPSTVTYDDITYHVTAIGAQAFYECKKMTSVTIPESVTFIGESAFSMCGLTSFTIPESVASIGDCAFRGCSGLTSLEIPESVLSIGRGAFEGTSISNPLYNSRVFAYMPVDYKGEYSIPFGIQLISDEAFSRCSGLVSVTIPESVTTIGQRAFLNCTGLISVTMPESVTTIGREAFCNCTGLTSVVLPASVTSVGTSVFSECIGLTSVTIPEGVTFIGDYAFSGCRGLTSVAIPKRVNIIGVGAFRNSGLISVAIPASVTSIGDMAFGGCYGLVSVTSWAENPPVCEGHVFFGRYDGATLYVPRGCEAAYKEAQYWNSFTHIRSITSMVMVHVDDETRGRVTGCGEYAFGTQATLTAIPNEGYTFDYWRDGGEVSYDNPLMLTVERDIVLTAVFSKKYYVVTLSVNDESMGRVMGGGQYGIGEKVQLEAISKDGYYFVRWDDGNIANPRMLTVTCDIVLRAIFAKNPSAANEQTLSAAPFAYVQGRTVYLSDGLGEVEAFTMTGRRVYCGFDRAIALPHPGVYILRVVADGRRCKVVVK